MSCSDQNCTAALTTTRQRPGLRGHPQAHLSVCPSVSLEEHPPPQSGCSPGPLCQLRLQAVPGSRAVLADRPSQASREQPGPCGDSRGGLSCGSHWPGSGCGRWGSSPIPGGGWGRAGRCCRGCGSGASGSHRRPLPHPARFLPSPLLVPVCLWSKAVSFGGKRHLLQSIVRPVALLPSGLAPPAWRHRRRRLS